MVRLKSGPRCPHSWCPSINARLRATHSAMRLTLVRHASAGHKRDWTGPDTERPLDERGRQQAIGLSSVLAEYAVGRIVSSPTLRCQQTVRPLADLLDRELETWSELGPDGVIQLIDSFAHPAFADAVLCTHGEVLQPLVRWKGMARAVRDRRLTSEALLTKGTAWRLHIDDNGQITKLVHLTPRSPDHSDGSR